MPRMTGNRFIAETLRDSGVTHIFQVPTAFFGVMREMEDMDIRWVVTHGEKAGPADIPGALERAFAAGKIAVLDMVSDIEAMGPVARPQDVRAEAFS